MESKEGNAEDGPVSPRSPPTMNPETSTLSLTDRLNEKEDVVRLKEDVQLKE